MGTGLGSTIGNNYDLCADLYLGRKVIDHDADGFCSIEGPDWYVFHQLDPIFALSSRSRIVE